MSEVSTNTTRDSKGIDRMLINIATTEGTVWESEFVMVQNATNQIMSAGTTSAGVFLGPIMEEGTSGDSGQSTGLIDTEMKVYLQAVTAASAGRQGWPVYLLNNNDMSMSRPASKAICLGALLPYKGSVSYCVDPGVGARIAGELHGFTKERHFLGTYNASDLTTTFYMQQFIPGGGAKIVAYGFMVNKSVVTTHADIVVGLYKGTDLIATTDTVRWQDTTVTGTAAGSYLAKTLTTPYEAHDADSIRVGVVSTATVWTAGIVSPYVDFEHIMGN